MNAIDQSHRYRTELGRITAATFGFGGYQEAMIGLSLTFGGKSWGVGHFEGAWGITRSEHCKWTEEDRLRQLGEACMKLKDTLEKAGKQHVGELVGVPVECTFDVNLLKSWRILEEVLPDRR